MEADELPAKAKSKTPGRKPAATKPAGRSKRITGSAASPKSKAAAKHTKTVEQDGAASSTRGQNGGHGKPANGNGKLGYYVLDMTEAWETMLKLYPQEVRDYFGVGKSRQ